MGFTEIFVATHDEALKHAGVLDAGSSAPAAKAVRITGISDFEVEQLGDLAGTAVHAGGADYELTMVDVSSDSLLAVPPAMVRALADLLTYETEGDGDVLDDVSAAVGCPGRHAVRCREDQGIRAAGSPNSPALWTTPSAPAFTSGPPEPSAAVPPACGNRPGGSSRNRCWHLAQ